VTVTKRRVDPIVIVAREARQGHQWHSLLSKRRSNMSSERAGMQRNAKYLYRIVVLAHRACIASPNCAPRTCNPPAQLHIINSKLSVNQISSSIQRTQDGNRESIQVSTQRQNFKLLITTKIIEKETTCRQSARTDQRQWMLITCYLLLINSKLNGGGNRIWYS
jgi:hypothetical protein